MTGTFTGPAWYTQFRVVNHDQFASGQPNPTFQISICQVCGALVDACNEWKHTNLHEEAATFRSIVCEVQDYLMDFLEREQSADEKQAIVSILETIQSAEVANAV